jgi:hypothetical protein
MVAYKHDRFDFGLVIIMYYECITLCKSQALN